MAEGSSILYECRVDMMQLKNFSIFLWPVRELADPNTAQQCV